MKRILLVEDDPDIQTIARFALEILGGYEVTACDSGTAALDAAARVVPDMVLLDVMMPGLDGPSTLRALRAQAPTAATPVVFMTAKAQSQEVISLHALGAQAVITKPFDPMTLTSQIEEIWARA